MKLDMLHLLFLTKDDILLRVGRHGKSWKGNLGKVFWEISLINTERVLLDTIKIL